MGAQWKTAIKSANASVKGKIFSKLAKDIIIAAKAGADPGMNARLRAAVELAKKQSMPREKIEHAIKKPVFGCRMCGQCVLHDTAMTCPMTCPKTLRNGPPDFASIR